VGLRSRFESACTALVPDLIGEVGSVHHDRAENFISGIRMGGNLRSKLWDLGAGLTFDFVFGWRLDSDFIGGSGKCS
jgi:hypothetical protein